MEICRVPGKPLLVKASARKRINEQERKWSYDENGEPNGNRFSTLKETLGNIDDRHRMACANPGFDHNDIRCFPKRGF
jgi:hypothetical protein